MSANPLAVAIAAGIEAARAVDEELIRRIVKEELARWRPETSGAVWKTVPKGAKAEGRSVKHVRCLVRGGLVLTRSRGISGNRIEINMDSLRCALRGEPGVGADTKSEQPTEAKEWARLRLAKKGAA